jgi:hypothetical protein
MKDLNKNKSKNKKKDNPDVLFQDPVVEAMRVANAIIAKGIIDGDEKVRYFKGISSRAIIEQRALIAIQALAFAASRSSELSKLCCKAALTRVGHAEA